jgi:hypothetical protein
MNHGTPLPAIKEDLFQRYRRKADGGREQKRSSAGRAFADHGGSQCRKLAEGRLELHGEIPRRA